MTQIEEKDDKKEVEYKFCIYGYYGAFKEYFVPDHFRFHVLKPVCCKDKLPVMVYPRSDLAIDQAATTQNKNLTYYDVIVDPNHYCWPKLAKLGVVDGDHIDIGTTKGHIACLILVDVAETLLVPIKRDYREHEIDKKIRRFDEIKSEAAEFRKAWRDIIMGASKARLSEIHN